MRWPEMPYPPLPSKPPERINHTSLLPHHGRPRRVSTLTGRVTTARTRWSRLEIATDVVGVIESSVPRRPQVP
jgi:hypothetical protein